MTDDRPEVEADLFSYRELPADPADAPAVWREMGDLMREGGAQFFRMTIVSPEYPSETHPNGLYMEGWLVDPARMETSSQPAPFNYPLSARDPQP